MSKVYVVCNGDYSVRLECRCNSIFKIFDSEDKAINYIIKIIKEAIENNINRKDPDPYLIKEPPTYEELKFGSGSVVYYEDADFISLLWYKDFEVE